VGFHLAVFLAATLLLQSDRGPRPIAGNPGPEYPSSAREAGVTGPVRFIAQVSETGVVTDVRVLEVPAKNLGFEDAVNGAVAKWRFEPAMRAGAPMASAYPGQIAFTLNLPVERSVRELAEKASAAWQGGDAKALTALFGPTGVILAGEERWIQGREEIEVAVRDVMESSGPGDPGVIIKSVTASGGVSAWSRWRFDLGGAEAQGQRPVELTLLLIDDQDRWSILAANVHPREFGAGFPEKLEDVPPVYPPAARQRRVQGTVVLAALLDSQGKPTKTRVLRSIPALDDAAITAVEKWRYAVAPASPPAWIVITVDFQFS
jgi:TonB family protein